MRVDESDIHDQIKLQAEINAITQEIDRAQQEFDIVSTTYDIDRSNATAGAQKDKAKNRLEDLRRKLNQVKFNK